MKELEYPFDAEQLMRKRKSIRKKLLEDPAKFNETFRVCYRAMGTEDTYWEAFAKDDAFLEGKGLDITRETFPGGHDWTVWRRCIRSFLPRLFKD